MTRRVLVAAVVLACCSGQASASTIQSAVFYGSLYAMGYRPPVFDGYGHGYWDIVEERAQLQNPGSAMVDVMSTTSWNCTWNGVCQYTGVVSQAIGQVLLAGGDSPTIDLLGSATVGQVRESATITYFFRLDALVADGPDSDVILNIHGRGSMTTEGYGSSTALVNYLSPSYSSPRVLLSWGQQTSSSDTEPLGYSGTEVLRPGQMARLYLSVTGSATGYFSSSGTAVAGEFQTILDPQVQIDPNYMVLYNGQMVPATTLYSLTFSPELFENPSGTPEPASLVLVGIGLIAMARLARRRNRRP